MKKVGYLLLLCMNLQLCGVAESGQQSTSSGFTNITSSIIKFAAENPMVWKAAMVLGTVLYRASDETYDGDERPSILPTPRSLVESTKDLVVGDFFERYNQKKSFSSSYIKYNPALEEGENSRLTLTLNQDSVIDEYQKKNIKSKNTNSIIIPNKDGKTYTYHSGLCLNLMNPIITDRINAFACYGARKISKIAPIDIYKHPFGMSICHCQPQAHTFLCRFWRASLDVGISEALTPLIQKKLTTPFLSYCIQTIPAISEDVQKQMKEAAEAAAQDTKPSQ